MSNADVLMPEQMINELQQEVESDSEKLARHQEQRSALGKQHDLDVGVPNEAVTLANGKHVTVRDEVGIALRFDHYAKSSCKTCMGRGSVTTIRPITKAQADKLIVDNPANEALIRQDKPGKYCVVDSSSVCFCARRQYIKRRSTFITVLIAAKLAKITGFKVVGNGQREHSVELL